MKMTELEYSGAQPPIDGYAPDGFRLAGRFHEGAVILSPGGAADWRAQSTMALDLAAAQPLLALKGDIDILLVGLGADVAQPPQGFRAAFSPVEAAADGFGVEYMATPAACRTYNVLLSEGRRVGAALLPIGASSEA